MAQNAKGSPLNPTGSQSSRTRDMMPTRVTFGGGANVPREREDGMDATNKIAKLEAQIAKLQMGNDNMKAATAAIVALQGGTVTLTPAELARQYQLTITQDPATGTITFVATTFEGDAA